MTADDLPLPTLLSRLLIAFTIEFDNEAEHRLEHRTTQGAAGGTGRAAGILTRWCCTAAGGPTAAERPMPVSPPGWAAPCRGGKIEP